MSTNQLSNDSVINRAQDSLQSRILGNHLGRLSILDILVVHCMHHTQEGDLGS